MSSKKEQKKRWKKNLDLFLGSNLGMNPQKINMRIKILHQKIIPQKEGETTILYFIVLVSPINGFDSELSIRTRSHFGRVELVKVKANFVEVQGWGRGLGSLCIRVYAKPQFLQKIKISPPEEFEKKVFVKEEF